MSEKKALLTPKGEAKSSMKKRADPALLAKSNGSKSKDLEGAEDMGLSEKTNLAPIEGQSVQKQPSNKSSKRDKLVHKNEVMFQERIDATLRSERSAKIMGSVDKQTTIKENHNTIAESNQREFSHSRDPQENLSVSKKKITTESKKSKPVESGAKHAKTETKNEEAASVAATEAKEEKTLNTVDEIANEACNEKVEERPERVEEQPDGAEEQTAEEEPKPEPAETKRSTRKAASKSKESKAGQDKEKTEVAKDTKMSKNLKRAGLCISEKETEEEKAKQKRSKSVKHGLRSETKSKDSKLNVVKSGAKKAKPNERWH